MLERRKELAPRGKALLRSWKRVHVPFSTARRHALVIATRNAKDYKHAGVDAVNPFD